MPGGNCAIYGCSVDRREKFKGISIFKIPGYSGQQQGNIEQKQWRDEFISTSLRCNGSSNMIYSKDLKEKKRFTVIGQAMAKFDLCFLGKIGEKIF